MVAILGTVGAVLVSAALVYLGNGLQGMVLPLRGVAESFPTLSLGLLGSAYAVGFMGGCLYGPLVIRRVGHIRAFAVFAVIAANAVLGYVIVLDPHAWLALRVVSGASLAGMFMVIESWLNECADNASRGRIFSAYMVVNYVAATSGQMTAALGDPRGFLLFAVACMLISAALIPVGLTTAITPTPPQRVVIRLAHLFRISPVGAAGACLVGVASGSFGTLGAVFVAQVGHTATDAALFMSAAVAGAALMQLPAGFLSDRVDRRTVIIGLATLAAATGLWMGLSDGDGPMRMASAALGLPAAWTWILGALVWGAVSYPLYGVCVAHMNDHVDPDGFVEATSGVLLLWSLGAIAGPFLASVAMSLAGPSALFLTTGAAHLAIAAFAAYRMTRRAAPVGPDKGSFVPTAVARTTPVALDLDPRSPTAADSATS